MLGQGLCITKFPSTLFPSNTFPSSSTSSGKTPKKGLVADPGFVSVTPGNGVIIIPPVSVCHQVSTMGHFSFPMTE